MSIYKDELASALLTDSLYDILARAESGDVLAAREALAHIAFLLSTSNTHPATGEPLPIHNFVRDYLAKSFYRMAQGDDANQSLNLKKAGKQIWNQSEKRLAADIVFQFVSHGRTLLESVMDAAEIINEHARSNPCPQAWLAFRGKEVSHEILQTWYYELKDELTEIHLRAVDL